MDRRSMWIGFLAGGWIATVLAVGVALVDLPFLRSARAEDPPPTGGGQQPFGPTGPIFPGPTVNPIGGFDRSGGTYSMGQGTADSNNKSIALSASIGNGESVVYYFDTEARRLLVYQYRGLVGHNKELSPSDTGGLRLLAARHIDYDLKLEAYRDLSEKTRGQLKDTFDSAFAAEGGKTPVPENLPTKKVNMPGGLR